MTTIRQLAGLGAVLSLTLSLSGALADQDTLQDELLHCAGLPDEAERVKCYDALARRTPQPAETSAADRPQDPRPVEDPPAPPEPASEPSSAQSLEITDDVGREQLEGGENTEASVYRAKVTSCQKNSSGRVFFFFENGQIWKQTDYSRFRHRDCNFDVALTRDAFGYKMKITGQKASYRVSRVK